MPAPIQESETVSAIVLTVALAAQVAETLIAAMQHLRWEVTTAHCDTYVSPARRPSILTKANPDICIAFVDFDRDQHEAIEATRYLHGQFAGRISVIAVSASNDPKLLLLAMRAGCTEFLEQPLDDGPLTEMLERLHRAWSHLPSRTVATETRSEGTVLSLFGAKGGVGTTTIAIHLATYLAQVHKKRTLFIDSRPELGHACIYLGLEGGECTFREVVRNVHRLDSELLRGLTARHSSGLDVLSSPESCEDMAEIDFSSMQRTLEFLRSEYDYVIVDGTLAADDSTGALVQLSTKVYLVATPDIGSIRDLSRQAERLGRIAGAEAKLNIVMNRFSAPAAVTSAQIQKVILQPLALTLPSSYPELVHADNLGKPLPPESKSEFTRLLLRWAASLVREPDCDEPVAKKRSLFGSLKIGLPNISALRRASSGA